MRAVYSNPRYVTAAIGMQFIGRQFDDDRNERAVPAPALADAGYSASTKAGLPGYRVIDFTVSRAFGRSVDVFVGVQNLLDQVYFVGTLPTTIGSPRLVNVGVRIRFAGK